MKVIWVAWPGEGEYDVYKSCEQAGIEFELYAVNKGHLWEAPFPWKLIDVSDVGRVINSNAADLYVLRYPQPRWSMPKSQSKVIAWTSEQGITRSYAVASSRPFQNVAVNNRMDEQYYKTIFPGKRIFYLPFGCYPTKPVWETKEKEYDIIVTSRCHYGCGCSKDRRQSIETMVVPILNRNIALYGTPYDTHGWDQVPGAKPKIKGGFDHWLHPEIMAKAKLCVAITWNWKTGGFGIQLARALATGIPVIWHKTVNMELEGFQKGVHLDWSGSPQETVNLVDYYLSHDQKRIEMGRRGREWFLENWEWSVNLKRIASEL